jgi:ribosomal protein S18 acetylase RimI-like enzyme
MGLSFRPATERDDPALWRVLEPTIRAGETFALPRDLDAAGAVAYWRAPGNEVVIAEDGDDVVGSYFVRANQRGGGAHVANAGYATLPSAGGRGIGEAMCLHSLELARARGFRAMQFNIVISSNERAVRLWQRCGFDIVGRVPAAFEHPALGLVDTLVMYRRL